MTTPHSNDIILHINELEYIVLQLQGPIEETSYFDYINVVVHTNDHHKYIIWSDWRWLLEFMDDFLSVLEKALSGGYAIQSEQVHNLGLNAMQAGFAYRHEINPERYEPLLALQDYLIIFDSDVDYVWLYRLNGALYLEITPHDPRRPMLDITQEKARALLQPYADNYRVLARFTLSDVMLRKWMRQIRELYSYARHNYDVNGSRSKNAANKRPLESLDICKHHNPRYGTDSIAHAQFIDQVHRLQDY